LQLQTGRTQASYPSGQSGKENDKSQLPTALAESVRSALYRFYYAVQRILVPGLRNSQDRYREVLTSYVEPETVWLDMGCGHQLFPEWLRDGEQAQASLMAKCRRIFGIDYDLYSLRNHRGIADRVRGDIQRLPFKDQSFDLVTANVVVEHVEDPKALLVEVLRVLKPGGFFLFHTPNLLSYGTLSTYLIPPALKAKAAYVLQGRKEEDVFPTHYRLNTSKAVKAMAQETGFTVFALMFLESSAQTVMLGPVVIIELLLIRMLRLNHLQGFRTNLVVALQKKGTG
jgi:ubiquinone/menaquinone biosynthesis C-methylase UbiE